MSSSPIDAFYYPAHEVQRPTHPRLHIRSAEDAHVLFEAVRRGLLRPVIRRLNDGERSLYIKSGSVFIWEESEEAIGLRRWTDGLVWSASRCRDPFLFYEARTKSSGGQSSSEREHSSSDTLNSSYAADAYYPTPATESGIPGLVKQTYSALVVGANARRQKLHLTAYFTHADYASLPTVHDDPILQSVTVPKGMYRSGKSRQSAKSLQEWAEAMAAGEVSPQGVASSGCESSPSASPSPNMGHLYQTRSPPSPYSSRPNSSHQSSSQTVPQQMSYMAHPTHSSPKLSDTSPRQQPYPPRLSMPSKVQLDHRSHTVMSPTTLPPLHPGIADQQFTSSPVGGIRPMTRASEDERMLGLLTYRP